MVANEVPRELKHKRIHGSSSTLEKLYVQNALFAQPPSIQHQHELNNLIWHFLWLWNAAIKHSQHILISNMEQKGNKRPATGKLLQQLFSLTIKCMILRSKDESGKADCDYWLLLNGNMDCHRYNETPISMRILWISNSISKSAPYYFWTLSREHCSKYTKQLFSSVDAFRVISFTVHHLIHIHTLAYHHQCWMEQMELHHLCIYGIHEFW